MAILKTEEAERDLEKIWRDAARDYGVDHAYRVLVRIDRLCGHLHTFPKMGQERAGLRSGIRYFPVKDYPFVLFFTEETDGILIVRILHDRMLPEKHV